jgi:hypothetical protein
MQLLQYMCTNMTTNKTLVMAGLGIATLIGAVSAVSMVSADNSSVATSTQAKKTWSFKWQLAKWQKTGTGRNGTGSRMNRGWKDNKWGMHKEWIMGWFGMHGIMGKGKNKNPAIEAAIKANDYNAFVTAWNADTKKPANATLPTQAQFNDMVTHAAKQATIEAAIAANDYTAFVEATKPTQAEFAKIVAKYNTHKAIEAAITANDYNAFVAAWNADVNKPANAIVPTQAQFTKMVNKTQNK